ncbi:MAG: hypothetical protein KGZ74_08035 [Chitinophagaceae bacterium]|nr:hypothetical protein [Chitinophagaceae bacterium]
MENPQQKLALVMSFEEWQKNKKWLLQFPGAFCIPVIEQMERYLFPIPVSGPSPDPSALVAEPNKSGLEPDASSNQNNQP